MLFVLLARSFDDGRSTASRPRRPRRGLIGYGAANTGFGGHRDHARDPARVRDPEAPALDAAPAAVYLAPSSLSNLLIVALQSLTLFVLGVLLYDATPRADARRSSSRSCIGAPASPGSGSRRPR
jgi:hypothetical protein